MSETQWDIYLFGTVYEVKFPKTILEEVLLELLQITMAEALEFWIAIEKREVN